MAGRIPETSLKFLDQLIGNEGASILEKDGVDRALTLVMRVGTEMIIGRATPAQAKNNGRRISLQNPVVSRTHCVVGMDNIGVYVKDMGAGSGGSTNGTFVNGRRLEGGQKLYVSENDTITLGKPHLPYEVVVRVVVKKNSPAGIFAGLRLPSMRQRTVSAS